MRTKYLIIIALPTSNSDGETRSAANNLYKKYSERQSNPIFCSQFELNTRSFVSKTKAKSGKGYRDYFFNSTDEKRSAMVKKIAGSDIDDNCNNSDDVGVYLVFHCDRNGFPTIFDACHAQWNSLKMEKSEVAFTLAQLIVDLGVEKIRKVALVACNTHLVQQNEAHCTFLEMFCGAAKGLFEHPPMIAGWDEYVEVDKDGSKKIGNSPAMKVTPELRNQHKFVARFTENKYTILGLEGSGWSDKDQLPTNLGCSSTIQ